MSGTADGSTDAGEWLYAREEAVVVPVCDTGVIAFVNLLLGVVAGDVASSLGRAGMSKGVDH